MPCESCGVQFSVFKRKRVCCECERGYCSGCLRRGGGAMCAPCRALSTRPLQRAAIAHLRPRDLQCFLQRQNLSTRGCVEKEELVSLCVGHVNSGAYRRRGARASPSSGAFSSLKGFTNNINELITSAFDLRNAHSTPAPAATMPVQTHGCCNPAHAHAAPAPGPRAPDRLPPERFSVTPGGERDVRGPATPPGGEAGAGVSRASSRDSTRIESADCFEIEDLDDAGWEFVTRPADPLPNDSEVLMCPTTEAGAARSQPRDRLLREHAGPELSPRATLGGRAASELELRTSPPPADPDSASLQDEPLLDATEPDRTDSPDPSHDGEVRLESLGGAAQLEALSVRQLKQLLARNRVEFRGCLERADLLRRARMLFHDHARYRDELERLPLEECCKICMAAPLECVLLECGHIAACTACSKQLAECPICRQYVVRAVRFFRS